MVPARAPKRMAPPRATAHASSSIECQLADVRARISGRHRMMIEAARRRAEATMPGRTETLPSGGLLATLSNDLLVLLAGRHLDADAIMALNCCCRSLHVVGCDPQVWELLLRRRHDELLGELGAAASYSRTLEAVRRQVAAGSTTPLNYDDLTWPHYYEWLEGQWREKRSVWERTRSVEREALAAARRVEAARQRSLFAWRVVNLALAPCSSAWFWRFLLAVLAGLMVARACVWTTQLEPIARAANLTAHADDMATAWAVCKVGFAGSIPLYALFFF